MKEDILEQIVEQYLTHQGYFVRHNVKFLPSRDHPDYQVQHGSNHSDMDVIGLHPIREGPDRVVAVSCKSWQSGFRPAALIAAIDQDKKMAGKSARKHFRELSMPRWSQAFCRTVERETGSTHFTYVTAVTRVVGSPTVWETHQPFRDAMEGNPIRLLTFREMLFAIQNDLTQTLAATEIGRMIQIIRAARISLVAD